MYRFREIVIKFSTYLTRVHLNTYSFASRLRNNKNYNRSKKKNHRSHGAPQSNIQFGKCLCGAARALAVDRSPHAVYLPPFRTIIAVPTDVRFPVPPAGTLAVYGRRERASAGRIDR